MECFKIMDFEAGYLKTLIDNLVESAREHEAEIMIDGGIVDDTTIAHSDLMNARRKLEKFINTLIGEAI